MKNNKNIKNLTVLLSIFMLHFTTAKEVHAGKKGTGFDGASSTGHAAIKERGRSSSHKGKESSRKGRSKHRGKGEIRIVETSPERASVHSAGSSDEGKGSIIVIHTPAASGSYKSPRHRKRSTSNPDSPRLTKDQSQKFTFTVVVHRDGSISQFPSVGEGKDSSKPEAKVTPLDLTPILEARKEAGKKAVIENALSIKKPKPRPKSVDNVNNMFLKSVIGGLDKLVRCDSIIAYDDTEDSSFEKVKKAIEAKNIIGIIEDILKNISNHPSILENLLSTEHRDIFLIIAKKLQVNKENLERKIAQGKAGGESLKRSLKRQIDYSLDLLKILQNELCIKTTIKSEMLALYDEMHAQRLFES